MASTPSRNLIVNADDFGMARGVNTGIIEGAEAGVVTSASMMVNLSAFDDAVARARSCPRLSVGLHLNLTVGRPLTDVPSLTRANGEFYKLHELAFRASLGRVDAADVTRESLAQIDRMIDAGLPPTHIDSHRHIHAHPAISAAVAQAAALRGISRVRVPREPLRVNAGDWRATIKKAGLRMCGGQSARAGSQNAVHFFGISLQGGKSFGSRLFALIPRLPAGTSELMTHPGYADASLAVLDGYTMERVTELKVLCSRDLRDHLARNGVTLTSFANGSNARQRELAEHH